MVFNFEEGWLNKSFKKKQNFIAFSALTVSVGHRERRSSCKKLIGVMLAWLSVWS